MHSLSPGKELNTQTKDGRRPQEVVELEGFDPSHCRRPSQQFTRDIHDPSDLYDPGNDRQPGKMSRQTFEILGNLHGSLTTNRSPGVAQDSSS